MIPTRKVHAALQPKSHFVRLTGRAREGPLGGMQTGGHDAAAFRTTRWSMVARAAASAHPRAPTALAEMCHDYWPPLYAFARRMGRSPQDAEDLTQGFFAALIEKNTLAAAEPSRGKLRTFLLAAFQHHIADAAKREHARRRGCGAETLSYRLRARYRELLLDLVAATLDDENPSTVEAEMRELLAALS